MEILNVVNESERIISEKGGKMPDWLPILERNEYSKIMGELQRVFAEHRNLQKFAGRDIRIWRCYNGKKERMPMRNRKEITRYDYTGQLY